MPRPPRLPVVPFRKRLLQPLHDSGKFQPVLRPDIKPQLILFKTQAANLKDKPKFGLVKHPVENRPDLTFLEQGFPVVDLGADFIPHTLLEYS
jgi:hypothetical protein